VFNKGKLFAAIAAAFALNTSIVFAATTDASASSANLKVSTHHLVQHGSTKPVYVTVEKGQTLWSISQRYGVSLASLERWNHLSDNSVLQIGQHLVVQSGPSSSSSLSSRDGTVDLAVAAASQGLDVTYYAEKFLGVPYAWGGTTPSGGFDCSGFTMFVFSHFGLSLPHTSYGQFQHGVSVAKSELRPGDLVFFSTAGDGASHVGIYVGQGNFINAAGNSIRYSSMSDGYWASNYVGARRILNG
jgi:peptidoglycan DL-endopeptidase LytE